MKSYELKVEGLYDDFGDVSGYFSYGHQDVNEFNRAIKEQGFIDGFDVDEIDHKYVYSVPVKSKPYDFKFVYTDTKGKGARPITIVTIN